LQRSATWIPGASKTGKSLELLFKYCTEKCSDPEYSKKYALTPNFHPGGQAPQAAGGACRAGVKKFGKIRGQSTFSNNVFEHSLTAISETHDIESRRIQSRQTVCLAFDTLPKKVL